MPSAPTFPRPVTLNVKSIDHHSKLVLLRVQIQPCLFFKEGVSLT